MDPAFLELQQLCLKKAKATIENDVAPDAAPDGDAARTAKVYVDIACSIEMINLQWAAQNRRCASGGTGTPRQVTEKVAKR